MAIATGGEVPEGADAVVPDRGRLRARTGSCTCGEPAAAGAHVRPRGGDLRNGETIVDAGVVLGAGARRGARRRRAPHRLAVAPPPARGGAHDRHRAPAAGHRARAGPDLRRQRADAGRARALGRRRGRPQLQAVADDEDAHRDALRARPRARRAGLLRRCLGRAARPRAQRRRGPRRGGGLLADRDAPGQAALVRRPRRHARVRAARQPRLDARLLRALRPARAARAAGPPLAGAPVRAGDARGAGSPERRSRRPRPRPPRGRDAHAGARSGVAHDRAGRGGRCAGARPPRRWRDRRGRHRAVSPDL